jgi:hypothetical protein
MSLYAMGSGMLDMLAEGLDLDAFLGAGDLAAGSSGAAAAAAAGGGAAGGNNGDGGVPSAPGGRASLRWLRASCQRCDSPLAVLWGWCWSTLCRACCCHASASMLPLIARPSDMTGLNPN